MSDTNSTITVLIVLLLIASGVAMAAKWVPAPYTLALVVVGLVISRDALSTSDSHFSRSDPAHFSAGAAI